MSLGRTAAVYSIALNPSLGYCVVIGQVAEWVSHDREADEMVQWTISSGERRELERTAGTNGRIAEACPLEILPDQGQVAEWFKAAVLKTAVGESSP
jgi:hypothetical protein